MDVGQFQGHTERLRRNTIIYATAAILLVIFDVRVSNVNLLGTKLENFGTAGIYTGLFLIISFTFMSFVWNAMDEVKTWKFKPYVGHHESLTNYVDSLESSLTNVTNALNEKGPDKAIQDTVNQTNSEARNVLRWLRKLRNQNFRFRTSVGARVALLEFALPTLLVAGALAGLLGWIDLGSLGLWLEDVFGPQSTNLELTD